MFTRNCFSASAFFLKFEVIKVLLRKMSVEPLGFIQQLNPTCGKTEWVEQSGDYDFHQEIARAAYADMLHDHDRNMKYYKALRMAVKLKKEEGQEAVVLDIGTGTGLLSMMAVAAGADKVFACEAFKPMAECAARVLNKNHMREKVTLIPKRSTDLLVGEGLDLPNRVNILVTEVFDTELIGEGAIQTFNHANEHLLTKDCIIIPGRAILFAQVVDCPQVPKWNTLNSIELPNGVTINFPKKISECPGVPSVHDVQLSEIKPEEFTALSEPLPVFQFDWKGVKNFESSTLKFTATNSGLTTGIFSWWDLIMDPEGQYTISCRPSWAGGKDLAWRDHWMQSIYYHPKHYDLEKGNDYSLQSFHDEFSIWFEISTSFTTPNATPAKRPICECGAHLALSRSRIGMWNDTDRNKKYTQVLKDALNERTDACCLILSEGSTLPFIAAGLGARKVFVLEPNSFSARVMKEFVNFNKKDQIIILEKSAEQVSAKDFENLKIDIVIGDPFFLTSVLPWHNLYFWYSIQSLNWSLANDVKMIPCKSNLKGIAVDFKDLWKIKAPVGNACNGEWDLSDFDDLILKSSSISDCPIDAQPLWEYPGSASSIPFTLQQFDFTKDITDSKNSVSLNGMKNYNGIALWMDWVLNENGITVSNGPICETHVGSPIKWDINSKQGVYFNWRKQSSEQVVAEDNTLKCQSSFRSSNGEIILTFDET